MRILTGEEKIQVINCLNELDCCLRCIIRFIGVTGPGAYVDPAGYLRSVNVDLKPEETLLPKKFRRNSCRNCLGIFQNGMIEKFVEALSSTNVEDYKFSSYLLQVSFPKAMAIRNHSMFIYLKEKFPHIYNSDDTVELVYMSKVFRAAAATFISNKVKKYPHVRSDLYLIFTIEYEDDFIEIKKINELNYTKTGKKQDTSKHSICAILEKCEDELFKKIFAVPPEIPNKEPYASVQCVGESMYLGGRYLKFGRNMSQTPWIASTEVKQDCLLDIISESVEKVLGYKQTQFTFCASGREDADVRMLGNGRPFYLQIDNPTDGSVTFEQLRAIEREVFKTKLAAVVKLQLVSKTDLKKIKEGEEHKRKHYNALCKTDVGNVDTAIKLINDYSAPLEVYQKTPLRVLHRRPQAVRKKYIYSMEAKAVQGHPDLIEVKFVTEAGTYVKEFVHGDFNRTTPNLTGIVGEHVDLVALDVTRVELDWP